jgi:hypothetical protein
MREGKITVENHLRSLLGRSLRIQPLLVVKVVKKDPTIRYGDAAALLWRLAGPTERRLSPLTGLCFPAGQGLDGKIRYTILTRSTSALPTTRALTRIHQRHPTISR